MEEATGYRDLDRLTAGHGSPPRTSVVRALPASGLHPITSRPACLSRPTPQPGGCYLLVAPRLCIVLRPARPAPAIGAGRGRALCPPARDGSSDSRSPGPSLGGSASGLIRLIPRSRPGLRLQASGKGDASAGQLGVARRCPPWRRLGPTLAHRLPASLNRHPALALPTAQQAPASSSTTAPRLDRAPVSGLLCWIRGHDQVIARPGRGGHMPPRSSMARATSASGERNPKAMRVRSRSLVFTLSTRALDSTWVSAASMPARWLSL